MWLVVGVYLAPVFIATVSQGRDRYDEDLSVHRRWFGAMSKVDVDWFGICRVL